MEGVTQPAISATFLGAIRVRSERGTTRGLLDGETIVAGDAGGNVYCFRLVVGGDSE